MRSIITLLLVLLLPHLASAREPVPDKVKAYFDAMKKHCSAQNLKGQAPLFAKEFQVTVTGLDGKTYTTKSTREHHIDYLKKFLSSVGDYKYDHKILGSVLKEDGSAYAKILVTQSYKQDGQIVRYVATEEMILQRSGDSFEAVSMSITYHNETTESEQGGAPNPLPAE